MTKQKLVSDQEGLDRAYASPIGLLSQGRTLFFAGTTRLAHVGEWWKIPANIVQSSSIYQNTLQYLRRRHRINRLVGHSYGGAVAVVVSNATPNTRL